MAGNRKPYFPDTKSRKADLDAQITAAEGSASVATPPSAPPPRAMSQADFSGYGRPGKKEGPPKEMLKKHFGQKFNTGGSVRGVGCATKGYGKAMKRGG